MEDYDVQRMILVPALTAAVIIRNSLAKRAARKTANKLAVHGRDENS